MMLAAQTNKGNQKKEVTLEGEGLTREVEEEAKRISTSVTNVRSWVTDILNVLRMRKWGREEHT